MIKTKELNCRHEILKAYAKLAENCLFIRVKNGGTCKGCYLRKYCNHKFHYLHYGERVMDIELMKSNLSYIYACIMNGEIDRLNLKGGDSNG